MMMIFIIIIYLYACSFDEPWCPVFICFIFYLWVSHKFSSFLLSFSNFSNFHIVFELMPYAITVNDNVKLVVTVFDLQLEGYGFNSQTGQCFVSHISRKFILHFSRALKWKGIVAVSCVLQDQKRILNCPILPWESGLISTTWHWKVETDHWLPYISLDPEWKGKYYLVHNLLIFSLCPT